MKIGLLVCTHNRPHYLKECLASLSRATMPEGTYIAIIDDCSNQETVEVIKNYKHPSAHVKHGLLFKHQRAGIKDSIRYGCESEATKDIDLFINLDSDALVRQDFIPELLKLHDQFPDTFISGFECTNLNEDGTPRHKIIEEGQGWKKRASAGGINLLFTPEMYRKHIEPILHIPDNWDRLATEQTGVICASPSLIQHIGLESSMGHSGEGRSMADVSDTFKPLGLPTITLIGVDSNKERLQSAFDESTREIHFGAVKLLHEPLNSKQAYSDYCIKELYKHVETSHLLIIQWDGYVKNWQAWDESWLQYDYIGAPWEWYTDGLQVGNGGFSLRSRRLMEIVANDPVFHTNNHPEDDCICRRKRIYLETQYGIKFAPIEVARKFSIEGYKHWNKTHTTEFGFHGSAIKFPVAEDGHGKIAYIQQYFGIGDVIFCIQLVRNMIRQGYKVCWPVLPDYVEGLNRAYPDITFIDTWLTQPKFMENRELVARGSTYYVPLRFTYELMNIPREQQMPMCMRSKYDYMHMDWETWRQGVFYRSAEREQRLMDELGIKPDVPYTLVNRNFQSNNLGKSAFPAPVGNIVEMTIRPGFSLFDWCAVIENAAEIHTVSTSIIYILEMLELAAKNVYIYKRLPQEQTHNNYAYILQRHKEKYILV